MTQSFTEFPEETPADFWVLSSRDYDSLSETLFYGETQIFECIYFNPSNYAVSMCNFEGVKPDNALEHYNAFSKHVKNDIKIISDDLYDYADEDEEEDEIENENEYGDEYKFVIVCDPRSNELKSKEWFKECRPILDKEGVNAYGINAFFVPLNRFKEF